MKHGRMTLTILVLACVSAGAFADEAPARRTVADQPGSDESAERTHVELVPLLTLRTDLRNMLQTLEYLRDDLEMEDVDSASMFEMVADTDELPVDWEQLESPIMRYELYLTTPEISQEPSMAADLVLPGNRASVEKMFQSETEREIEDRGDGVLIVDDSVCVTNDRYIAIALMEHEGITTVGEVARLRKLLGEVEDERLTKSFSISSRPRDIGRSRFKPILNAFRASLLTQSQRYDDEQSLSWLARSMYLKSAVGIYDSIFQNIETIEFSYTFDEQQKDASVELRLEAQEDSDAAQYIRSLRHIKNRSLSWLHPKHESFTTVCLPLPKLIRESLPQLARAAAAAVHERFRLPHDPTVAVERIIGQFVDDGQLQCLCQSIPLAEDSSATIVVIPLHAASSLETTSVELVSATRTDTVQLNIGDAAGWPVHTASVPDDLLGEVTDQESFFWVLTDDCAALMFGDAESETMLALLSEVLARDFESPAVADLFSRAALATSTNARDLARRKSIAFPKALARRMGNDPSIVPEDRIVTTLLPGSDTLSLKATFERDAATMSVLTYEAGLTLLLSIVDELE